MPSLLSSVEISGITGTFEDIFDTFKRNIVIHKEPTKTVTTPASGMLYGYGDDSNQENYSYTPRSGTYEAKISYVERRSDDPYVRELTSRIENDLVRIKVKEIAKNYIADGRTEKITFDNKTFKIAGNEIVKNFLGSEFYIYYLEETS